MVYYNNPYKNILRAFIRAIKVFFSSLVSKSVLITIICFLIILLFINENHVSAATQTIDISELEFEIQEERQNSFVLYAYNEFLNNTNAWNDDLKPFFDELLEKNFDIFCNAPMNNNTVINHKVYLYNAENNYTEESINAYNNYNSQQDTRKNRIYKNIWAYDFTYNKSTGITNYARIYPSTVTVPLALRSYKSDLLNDFLLLINGYNTTGSVNYTNILNDISNYLSSIKDYNSYINYSLSNILSILNTIANKTENDYTEQITGITDQVNILNSSIQAQTQQQHQDAQATENAINNQTTKIEEQTNSINDMSNFMQDDSFSGDSITNNMPSSDEFQDVTENGFDNIFTLLRDTFTSDNYKDIVIGVPFSNGQSITIPSNLTENFIPEVIKNLIQMVYWYFIARFIVKDIAGYIEKAKSGDVFSSTDTNIKTDML